MEWMKKFHAPGCTHHAPAVLSSEIYVFRQKIKSDSIEMIYRIHHTFGSQSHPTECEFVDCMRGLDSSVFRVFSAQCPPAKSFTIHNISYLLNIILELFAGNYVCIHESMWCAAIAVCRLPSSLLPELFLHAHDKIRVHGPTQAAKLISRDTKINITLSQLAPSAVAGVESANFFARIPYWSSNISRENLAWFYRLIHYDYYYYSFVLTSSSRRK